MKKCPQFRAVAKVLLVVALSSIASFVSATPVFFEDFGTLANGTSITTSNTDFTYVRVGTGGGSITALNPSTVSTGASMMLAGPSSTSLNGVGVQTGLGLASVAELSFKLKFDDASTGTLLVGMGNGTMFTSNNTFSGSQLLFGLQSLNGVLQYRDDSGATGSWVNAGFTFSSATAYDLNIAASGSDLQITINGSPLSLITNSRNSQNADAFRIYAVSGTVGYEIDDIIVQVPEPSGAILGVLGVAGLVFFYRSRRHRSSPRP